MRFDQFTDSQNVHEVRKREQLTASHDTTPTAGRAVTSNHALQRLLARQADVAGGPVDDAVRASIAASRGGGSALPREVASSMGQAMGDDFGDVRVHADTSAHELNTAVQADAFTVGNDVYFREGKYDPTSSSGQSLLAHELTHVVQQRGTPAGSVPSVVSDPDDASERQASTVASGMTGGVVATAPHLQREVAPEEEELQTSPHLQREEAPEEEEL